MYEFYTVVDLTHDDPALSQLPGLPCSKDPFCWEAADGPVHGEHRTPWMAYRTAHTADGWAK